MGKRSILGRSYRRYDPAALESCAAGTMWTDYEPTPMTREWLVEKGFISK